MVAKLTEIDTLPGAEVKFVIGDGNSDRGAGEYRLDMRRHIIISLIIVGVVLLALHDYPIECRLKIYAHRGISILIDSQSCKGMLDKELEQAGLGQWRQVAHYDICDEMKAPFVRRQG